MTPLPIRFVAHTEEGKPGDAKFYSRYKDATNKPIGLIHRCPKCGGLGILPFRGVGHPDELKGHTWEWNGGVKKPTLKPSIVHDSQNCGWHGYLIDGLWREDEPT